MQNIKDLNQEIRKLSAFKRLDIVAHRGAVCNDVLCFLGELYSKASVPNSRDQTI